MTGDRSSLPWRARALMSAQGLLMRARLVPGVAASLGRPVAERTALGPPKLLVGAVPTVSAEDHQVQTRDGDMIRVRVYRAAAATDQPLLYLHGGGWAVGGLRACDHICRRLAHESGAVVVSVEYRLAPEHPYPTAVHDAVDAAQWLLAQAEDLAVDPARLVVGGDSAGGNLAAVLAVLFRDEGRPLAGQLLIYPAVDLSMSLPGIHAYQRGALKADDLAVAVRAYVGDHDPTDPYVSPWFAEPQGLAPAMVVTVGYDPLQHEGDAYAGKLRAAGVPVTHVHVPGHAHASLSLPRLYRGIDDLYRQITDFVVSVPSTSQPAETG
jgi:acetyl esterase